jgi:hypothetical protein
MFNGFINGNMKKYYVTKNRVNLYIETVKHKFNSYKELLWELKAVLSDLREFKDDNSNQIHFFEKVEQRVVVLSMVEQMAAK